MQAKLKNRSRDGVRTCEEFWTPEGVRQAASGRWVVEPGSRLTAGVSTDTRTVQRGQVFVALVGEKLDGHDYLRQAAEGGASVVVVSDGAKARGLSGVGVLEVEDTLVALQGMAGAYRDCLRGDGVTVVGVTGSNGKTTTRHLIHGVLSSRWAGSQSPKSFNNHIGVPLTLLGVRPGERFVVAEIGTNHPGEIAALGALARPDVAVVTNVGSAHIGMFGSREAIAEEKTSLLRFVSPDGLAVVPGGDAGVDGHLGRVPGGVEIVRFGVGGENQVRLTRWRQAAEGLTFEVEVNGQTESGFGLPMLGRHNAVNALAAIAVGGWMGLELPAIADALRQVTGVPMRLGVTRLGTAGASLVVINDAYNANPDSVAGAVRVLAEYPLPLVTGGGGRRVLILGDMFELGDEAAGLHREVGRKILASREAVGLVILVGELSKHTAEVLRESGVGDRVLWFNGWDEGLGERVAGVIEPGDVVLLKASRGMGLERLVPSLERAVKSWGS